MSLLHSDALSPSFASFNLTPVETNPARAKFRIAFLSAAAFAGIIANDRELAYALAHWNPDRTQDPLEYAMQELKRRRDLEARGRMRRLQLEGEEE